MIITGIKISNIYGFQNTEFDFSYARKPQYNTIENEFLPQRPNFNFKRVCIISGTNASGKTSLGRVICGIQNFISKNIIPPELLTETICDQSKAAEIEIEFVTPLDNVFHRLELSFVNQAIAITRLKYASLPIGKQDSCTSMRNKMKSVMEGSKKGWNYISSDEQGVSEAFKNFQKINIHDASWLFMFTNNYNEHELDTHSFKINPELFKMILNTFDPSIKSVEVVTNTNEDIMGYMIHFDNQDSVFINLAGEVSPAKNRLNRFSKGTYDAIKLTSFINRVVEEGQTENNSTTFFLDEQMAYSHSDLEQNIVNIIIGHLSPLSQFFYTTHNYDILDMGLPVHSYLLMKKENQFSEVIHPQHFFKKNDRSLLNYIKNDYFKTLPSTQQLERLL